MSADVPIDDSDRWLTQAYAEGRKDEREAVDQELVSIIKGPYYMDPPDGGDVSLMEQLRRMAQDAAKWREHAARTDRAIACELACEGGASHEADA